MCNCCENKKKLIHNSHLDTESMIFSVIDLKIRNNNLIATANASYECEEVQEQGMIETTVETDITGTIPIKYCPICGKQLKENE